MIRFFLLSAHVNKQLQKINKTVKTTDDSLIQWATPLAAELLKRFAHVKIRTIAETVDYFVISLVIFHDLT